MAFRHSRLARSIPAILVLLTASLPGLASARLFQFKPLDAVVYQRLSPEARAAYDEALEAVDHIDYEIALERLEAAVAADPDRVELRFIAASLAQHRGETTTGVESARLFESAMGHVRHILSIDTISQKDRQRAEYMERAVDTRRKTIEERDEKRRTYGMQIAKAYAKEVYSGDPGSAEIAAFKEAISKLTKPGSASARATAAAAEALSRTIGEVQGAPGALDMADEGLAAAEGRAAPTEGVEGEIAADPLEIPPPPPPAAGSAMLGASTFSRPLQGEREQLDPAGEDFASAKAFVDQFFPAVLGEWSFDAFQASLDPKFIEGLPEVGQGMDKEAIARGLFSMLQGVLGNMQEYKGCVGELYAIETLNGKVLAGPFQAAVTFEKGTTPIYMEVVKRVADGETEWKVRDFNFDVKQVNELSGGQLGMLMGAMGGGGGGIPGLSGGAPAAPAAPAAPPAASNPFN